VAKQSFLKHLLIVLCILSLSACAGDGASTFEPRASLSAVEAVSGSNVEGFARALEPRPFVFPRDHGAHPEYATEWWYYTGNLDTPDGKHFGFQLTFFRSSLTPTPVERSSDWAADHIYMAHFTLSNVSTGEFRAFERFSRGALGLAGATGEPFRVWVEDWSAEGSGPEGMTMRLRAAQDDVAIDLTVENQRPPMLQGDQGLSQKSPTPGNASYYYSLPHMRTNGTITSAGQSYSVSGFTWMDHEFSSSALDAGAVGWDWFGLQLDDGRGLTYARIRNQAGETTYSLAALAEADGRTLDLTEQAATLTPLNTWRSPHTGIEYPSGWRLQIPSAAIDLEITPWLLDQELQVAVIYWEGAVQIRGTIAGQTITGNGYVELTGYGDNRSDEPRIR